MEQNGLGFGGIAYNKFGLNGNSSDSLMTLLDLIDDFNRQVDSEQLAAKIDEAAQSLMNAEASSLMLLSENNESLKVIHATGPVKDDVCNRTVSVDAGFCGWVTEHKLPLIANDIRIDNEFFAGELSENFKTRNLICAPLLDEENNVIGVIEAINCNPPKALEEGDIPVFQALANHAATAIERDRRQQERTNRYKEQNTYLTEIHHRVKNDLALISGIVQIESLDIENEKAKKVLQNIESRIQSMAVVYELLSGEGSHNKAEVGTYFKKLVEGISEGLSNREKDITIQVHSESVVLDPYKALSCGLILNELLLNAYKHAFADRKTGTITIDLSKNGNRIMMDYRDDGVGFPEDFKLEEQDSLGFKMINALIKQLDGQLTLSNENGARFVVTFEVEETKTKKLKTA